MLVLASFGMHTIWHRLCVHRPLVSNVLLLSLLQWEIHTRSTWKSRCVFRCCVGSGVMRHSYHLSKILRPQATRSQVKRPSSQRAHREHAPNDVVEKVPVRSLRVSSEDRRTPVRGQTVKQCAELRSALESFAPRRHVCASAPRTDVDAHTSRLYVGSNASQWTV